MTFGPFDILLVIVLLAYPFTDLGAYGSRQRLAWFSGVVVVGLAVFGQLGGNPRQIFLATTIQFCLLFFVAPVLLALGTPHRFRPPKILSFVGPILACVVTLAWFFTPWLHASLTNVFLFQLGHLLALLAGLLFCVPAVRAGGHEASAYPGLLFVAFLELLLDAIPGILITIRDTLLAPTVYLRYSTHTAAHTSQMHGGEVLWIIAEVLDIPFLAALVYYWVRADARQAAVIDARLDAHSPPPSEGNTGDRQRPWWETDASVFGDRAKDFESDD